jgi:hypothetical protein
MRTVISQSVVLPAPAEGLFAMYTDPAKHAAITGAPARAHAVHSDAIRDQCSMSIGLPDIARLARRDSGCDCPTTLPSTSRD